MEKRKGLRGQTGRTAWNASRLAVFMLPLRAVQIAFLRKKAIGATERSP
jgi:hypothetical protein